MEKMILMIIFRKDNISWDGEISLEAELQDQQRCEDFEENHFSRHCSFVEAFEYKNPSDTYDSTDWGVFLLRSLVEWKIIFCT